MSTCSKTTIQTNLQLIKKLFEKKNTVQTLTYLLKCTIKVIYRSM